MIIPQHIAFIVDGNRRWATKKKLKKIEGHKQGMEKIFEIINYCYKIPIKYLSFFCFSTENWKRSKEEINSIISIMNEAIKEVDKKLDSVKARLKFIGDLSPFPIPTQNKLKQLEKKTLKNKEMNLVFFLNYSGRDDIVLAVNKLIKEKNSLITKEDFAYALSSHFLPDPDILIRTSGEMRLSNFFLWELSYTELFFSKDLWPDFSIQTLKNFIQEFSQRQRRFGI